jgi:hypothetical protein
MIRCMVPDMRGETMSGGVVTPGTFLQPGPWGSSYPWTARSGSLPSSVNGITFAAGRPPCHLPHRIGCGVSSLGGGVLWSCVTSPLGSAAGYIYISACSQDGMSYMSSVWLNRHANSSGSWRMCLKHALALEVHHACSCRVNSRWLFQDVLA